MKNSHFILYANCIPVKGAARSLICDLQRQRFHFIPNDLFDILNDNSRWSVNEILEIYGVENASIVNEYFDFLLKEEYIFYCSADELDLFPKLDLKWDHPSVITNSIIDIGEKYTHDFAEIFRQLEMLGCKDIQLRFYRKISIQSLAEIIQLLEFSVIRSVEIFLLYDEELIKEDLIKFSHKFLRVFNLTIHSSPYDYHVEAYGTIPTNINYTKAVISNATHCGFISVDYFQLNINVFTEGHKNNSCLNRKISIDENGEIKNCPSMLTSFGNFKNITLNKVLESNAEFKKVWSIDKNQIDICRDCEFRFMCTDCRAFTLNDEQYGKPSKCCYNPYLAAWE